VHRHDRGQVLNAVRDERADQCVRQAGSSQVKRDIHRRVRTKTLQGTLRVAAAVSNYRTRRIQAAVEPKEGGSVMRSKLRKWGLSVVTMVSVATAVLFVTGWGSAIAADVTPMFITNSAKDPIPVVNGDRTQLIASGVTMVPAHSNVYLFGQPKEPSTPIDVSSFKTVVFYANCHSPNDLSLEGASFSTEIDSVRRFLIGTISLHSSYASGFTWSDSVLQYKNSSGPPSFIPVPPNLTGSWSNRGDAPAKIAWMLMGRPD
jgi:hypothetical protein